jgi:phage terminase large subunit-like protein
MVALISGHEWLSARCNIIRFRKEIEDVENGSIYQALSREAKTKMGFNPSMVVYDELGQASDRDLFDAMDSALGARKDPLLLVISTQAADDFAPLSQLIDYGVRVKDGAIKDPAFHLTLYAAPDTADPWSKAAWKKANPALDDFLSLDHARLVGAGDLLGRSERCLSCAAVLLDTRQSERARKRRQGPI